MRTLVTMAVASVVVLSAPTGGWAGGRDVLSIKSGWTASGNEPNWALRLEDGKLQLDRLDGPSIVAAMPAPRRGSGRLVYRLPEVGLTVSLRQQTCRDSMTGMPRPVSVRVQLAKSTFKGCGGETAELLDGEWRVAKIGTLRVPTKLAVSIAFDVAARQVSGASGCNRYFGGFELTAESLSISRSLAGSMMACEEKATRIEEAFKASLPRVRRFDIAADGSLHLLSDGQSIVVARRVATTR